MEHIKKSKLMVLIIMLSVFLAVSSEHDVFIIEGECYKVIKLLREEYKNDSLAIDYFQKNYVIDKNCEIKDIGKGDAYKKIIKYYNLPENKDCHCTLKSHYYNKTLIDNSNEINQ